MSRIWSQTSIATVASALVGAVLSGCGGGGGGSAAPEAVTTTPPVVAKPSLAGVAAVGAPMSGATVTLTDASGRSVTVTAAADGSYRFEDLSGYTAPFQIQASAAMGEAVVTHHALVPAAPVGAAVANVTPLTTAVAALSSPTELPGGLSSAQLSAITPAALQAAGSKVATVIAPLATRLGLGADFDPLRTSFSANGLGPDLLLDHLDVAVAPGSVTLANKMAVATEGQSSAAGDSVINKNSSAAPAPLAATDTTNTQGFDDISARLAACFAVPAAQRLVIAGNTGTLHSACQGLAAAGYVHNGTPFINRWAAMLRSATFDGTTFGRPVVRLRVSAAPERIAVNFNFKDSNGAGYTRPEIIERQSDGRWLMVGNDRRFNAYAEAQSTYMNDLTGSTPYNNVNSSRVDTGFRLSFDPRASFDSSGTITYNGLDLASGGYSSASFSDIRATLDTGSRMVGCVVVRGPGERVGAKWSGIHPNGLLLKRPTGSTVQDYLAIDAIVSDAWRTAIDATAPSAAGAVAAPRNGTATNICGNGTTATSSSSYVVDLQALGARKHAITGQTDSSIAGRDVAWNTGPRFARLAPTGNVKAALEANPPLTFEVFDTDGRLRSVFTSRYLGRLPDLALARAYVESRLVPEFDVDSLRRYLDFSTGSDTVRQTVTGTVSVAWNTPAGAFGADRIGLYSEIYRATPGVGIRGPLSRAFDNTSNVSSLWASDADLAEHLDTLPGTNFYWWNGSYAQPTAGTGTACTGSTLVSTSGVNVGRSASSIGAGSAYAGSLYGTDALASACLGPASHAALYREMFIRSYTDTNVRLYVTTAARQLRAPAN